MKERVLSDAAEAKVYREYLAIKALPSVTSLCGKWRISRQLLQKVIARQKKKALASIHTAKATPTTPPEKQSSEQSHSTPATTNKATGVSPGPRQEKKSA